MLKTDAPLRIAHLHYGAFLDKQSRQVGGLGKRAATIATQVDHQAINVLRLQLVDQFHHVARRTAEIRIAAARAFKVMIEGRQRDHPNAVLRLPAGAGADLSRVGNRSGRFDRGERPRIADFDQRTLCCLIFEFDLFAYHRHAFDLAVGASIRWQHVDAQRSALLAADLLHHVIDFPADHVGHRRLGALANADDAVARLELSALGSRSALDDLTNHRVLVFALQHRADAFQRQPHLDVEILRSTRPQIVGVRLDLLRVRVHEVLEDILGIEVAQPFGVAAVALVQGFSDALVVLARQLQAQPIVLDALAPKIVELSAGFGPGRFLAAELVALVDGEVEAPLDQRARVPGALFHARAIAMVDRKRRIEFLIENRIVERFAIDVELVYVRRQEHHLVCVERLDEAVQHARRHGIVQGHTLVMEPGQKARRPQRCVAQIFGR